MLTIVLSDIESILLMNMLHDTLVDDAEINKYNISDPVVRTSIHVPYLLYSCCDTIYQYFFLVMAVRSGTINK